MKNQKSMANNRWIAFRGQRWKIWHTSAIYLLFTLCYLSSITPLHAADRTNVPLKNWGGFSVNRSWIYDALEKVVLAGLADQV
ncbi:MAG TPA: hypothetical protein ACFYEC_04505, partial [Candidatus Brocadiaceae bacterium]